MHVYVSVKRYLLKYWNLWNIIHGKGILFLLYFFLSLCLTGSDLDILFLTLTDTDFPGVPISRPNIVDMEPDSVRVSWQKVDIPSFSAKDEPLLYLLEMQEPPKRDWQQIARDIPDHNYTVKGLTPGQDYRFRVKARTMGGAYGEPSPSTSMYRTLGKFSMFCLFRCYFIIVWSFVVFYHKAGTIIFKKKEEKKKKGSLH